MGKLKIDQEKVNPKVAEELIKICPFNGFDYDGKVLGFTAGCKVCKLCVRRGPQGVVTFEEDESSPKIDKSIWRGIGVYIEHDGKKIHPVSFELIGKAKELAKKINHPVYALLIGTKEFTSSVTNEILSYGVDNIYTYQNEILALFNIERYTKIAADFIEKIKPTALLYGGTSLGRSFAPRVAAHFRTGLTADCTVLDMKENTDLVQIRPAFGGNVMAQIITPNHRPQMATVRYKMFKMPEKVKPFGKITQMVTSHLDLASHIEILKTEAKELAKDISEAEVIVACGRIFKTEEDMQMAEELASLLGGIVAVTRPLVEAGLRDSKLQIGLSGRTVAPKLIFNLGISGAVQYTAGMTGSEVIITINSDPNASIFGVSHYGIVGDVFKIVPELINHLKKEKGVKLDELSFTK